MNRRCRYAVIASLTALVLGGSAWAAADDETLPLPRWPEQETAAMPANRLWPDGMIDMAPLTTPGTTLAEDSPSDSPEAEQPHADLSNFLPPSLVNHGPRSHPLPSASNVVLKEVSAGFLQQAAAVPITDHLIDPDQVIPEVTREDLGRFLESHARDARIKLYVLILGQNEKLPTDANLASLAQGSLLQSDACLAVIPLGEPWRLRLFMSRSLHEAVPGAQLAEVLDDTVRDSLQASAPEDQLHRLLVRLSIRLFWLESGLPPAPVETVARAVLVNSPPTALPEIVAVAIARPASARSAFSSWWLALLLPPVAIFVAWRWHLYRLRHYEWVLPEPDSITPRFGCPQAATAAWVRYQ